MQDDTDPELPQAREGNRPMFWRLAHVAPSFGFSPDLMLSAIHAGQLPIRAEQFGTKGLWFLRSADVLAYINNAITEEVPK